MTNEEVVAFCRRYRNEYFDFDQHAARFRLNRWDFLTFKIIAMMEEVWMPSMDQLDRDFS